jgi:hypothetical protein
MIRTVWLTIAGLAVLGALLVGKVVKTSVVLAATTSVNVTTIGSSSAQAPLIKADRLEFAYARQVTPARSALQPTAEPSISPVATIVPPVEPKIISRHWHDANATTSSVGKSKQPSSMAASKKGKPVDPKVSRAAERSKPAENAKKPCKQTGATISDLLRSLNLSPDCAS